MTDWAFAGGFVSVVLSGLTGGILFALLRPAFGASAGGPQRRAGVPAAVALMLIAPITIFTWSQQNLYFGYIPAHVYHNPTQVALKPFALLFFVAALRVFSDRVRRALFIALTFALGLCATLAKPSLSICLIPALGVVTRIASIADSRFNGYC